MEPTSEIRAPARVENKIPVIATLKSKGAEVARKVLPEKTRKWLTEAVSHLQRGSGRKALETMSVPPSVEPPTSRDREPTPVPVNETRPVEPIPQVPVDSTKEAPIVIEAAEPPTAEKPGEISGNEKSDSITEEIEITPVSGNLKAAKESSDEEMAMNIRRIEEKKETAPRLTKVEAHQVEKRTTHPDDEAAYIKFFQKNAELRNSVVKEPFAVTTKDEISPIFGQNESTGKVLRAAILAEPEGAYEKSFNELTRADQLQKLYDQIDSSAEMTIRLQKYVENNLPELDKTSDEVLYKELVKAAFETDEENTIQEKYALSQRRGFRLSIANLIEDRGKLLKYRFESSVEPKLFAEKYLKQQFTGKVSIEPLPIGFVIYLDEEDYALIESDEKSAKSIQSAGVTLSHSYLPDALKGKIILLNKGGKENGIKTESELSSTRGHEIRHLMFGTFHQQQSENYMSDTREALTKCQTEQDYQKVSGLIYEDFVEKAKDEIIAYYSQGKFDESYNALRFHQYKWHIEEVEMALNGKQDMSAETKKTILDTFTANRKKSFESVRRIRFVAEKMDEQSRNGAIDHDKAEALLRNTPGTKIDRLAKYTGLSVDDIRSDKIMNEKDQQTIQDLNSLLSIPEWYEAPWWDKVSQIRDKIQQQLPVGILPTLLDAVSKWSERDWSAFWVEEAISLTKDIINIQGVTTQEREKINQVMEAVVSKRTGTEGFDGSVKMAKEVVSLK